jgi:hypothetical protein
MAKAIPIELQLSALAALREDPSSGANRAELSRALGSKSNLVAAKAATIITDAQLIDFLPALAGALDRFFADGSDKGCIAKTAIAKALYTLGHNDPAAFVRGIHHVQTEGGFGSSSDAAAELRGWCGLGLARMGYADVLLELAELLMDRESQARVIAARAIAYTGSEHGTPLLRMKVQGGDAEPEVIAECFIGLMKLSPRKSLPFVARFLRGDDAEMAESAALAIGGSRLPEAFELLRQEWEANLRSEPRRPLLMGIAMTRLPAAVEFLLQRITDDRPVPAADAVSAMAIFKHEESIKSRVLAIATDRGEADLITAAGKAFAR